MIEALAELMEPELRVVRKKAMSEERELNIMFMLKHGMETLLRESSEYSDEEIDRIISKMSEETDDND